MPDEKWFYKLFLNKENTIRDGLKLLNENGHQVIFITDKSGSLEGVVTDGDFRRSIFEGISFDTELKQVMTKEPVILKHPIKTDYVIHLLKDKGIRYIPVVDENNQIIDVVFWKDFIRPKDFIPEQRDEQVVIMAGGKGTRLDPFTKILPKPLIPFGEKTMIEWIMDNFIKFGLSKFAVTLNYKKEAIKNYFLSSNKGYSVSFVEEDEFLGTAGSLFLLKDKIKNTFIVTNCDIVLEEDFLKVLNFHYENKNKITVVGVPRHEKIAYGVIEMNGETLSEIREKPEMTFLVSAGVYIIEPEVINYIEENEYTEMPDLIKKVLADKPDKVGVFPTGGKWFDVGQWEDYQNALVRLSTGDLT
jgi:dTDP-glucose pyrophosphorylase